VAHKDWLEKQYPQQINRERLCQEELPKELADLRVVLCYALQPLSREVLGQQLRVELALLLIKAGQQLAEQERKVRPDAKKDTSNRMLEPDWKLVAVEYLAEVARLLRLIEDEEPQSGEFLLLLGSLVEAGVCLATAKGQSVNEARWQVYQRLDRLAVKLLLRPA
jgi:hypothetical protein